MCEGHIGSDRIVKFAKFRTGVRLLPNANAGQKRSGDREDSVDFLMGIFARGCRLEMIGGRKQGRQHSTRQLGHRCPTAVV